MKKPRPADIINEIKMVGIYGTEDYRRKNFLGLYPKQKQVSNSQNSETILQLKPITEQF